MLQGQRFVTKVQGAMTGMVENCVTLLQNGSIREQSVILKVEHWSESQKLLNIDF